MKKSSLLHVALLFVIVIQFIMPYPALADDLPPATPEATEETTPVDIPPTDETQLPEVLPSETEQASETVTVETTESAEVPPATEIPALEEIPTEGILEALPENADLVILDAGSQPLPLATESAASAIATSDPAWCPEGTSLSAGTCTSYATFTELLTGLHSLGTLTNGTVYVQKDVYAGAETSITFNGTYLPKVGDLILVGGWDLTLPTPQTQDGWSTTLGVPLSFTNWTHDLTLQDINIENASGNGLTIQTSGDVTLTDVSTIDNRGDGINIQSNASITLNNVVSTLNDGNGLTITATPVLQDVSYTEEFVKGPVTVMAPDYSEPIYVETGALFVTRYSSIPAQTIDIRNSKFDDNTGNGFSITTPGTITLSNVSASFNDKSGAVIERFANPKPPFPWFYFWNRPYPQLYDLYAYDKQYSMKSNVTNITFSNNGEYGLVQQGHQGAEFGDTRIDNYRFVWYFVINATMENNGLGGNFGTWTTFPIPPMLGDIPILGGESMYVGKDANVMNLSVSNDDTNRAQIGTKKALCESMSLFALQLPSGDSLIVYCPVNGMLSVDNLGRKVLPAPLPNGLTFLSALEVNLSQNGTPTQIITEEGRLKPSFIQPVDQPNGDFVVLFWDASVNQWVELPVFGSEGNESFQNGGTVLEGVQVLDNIGRVEVDVNFPGVFVLTVR
jgi:hypothetical protein